MRVLLAVLLIMLSLSAFAASPRGIVMGEECKQANEKKLGFVCHLHPARGLWMEWVEDTSKMPADRKSKALYEFNRTILRYHELGGQHFDITSKGWPAGRKQECTVRPNLNFLCFSFQCRADGTQCELMENPHK